MVDASVRVPPDSTGKRVGTVKRTILNFDNKTGTIAVGDTITGATSNATGTVTGIDTTAVGIDTTDGRLWLEDVSGTFIDNENLEISSSPVAVVNINGTHGHAQEDIYYQQMVITDPDNPYNRQKIDQFGATVNTFTEGSPIFSSFGAMVVGEAETIADYRYAYDLQTDSFWDQTVNGATLTYESDAGLALLTNPTTSGALVSRTSHLYHEYIPGIGKVIEMTLAIGDTGKSNVRRRWGYFDDENGVFFQLDGTTLSVGLRSNVTGSVVDTIIAQSNWNTDKLDGSDAIDFNLDVTKGNIYWMDMQWLGAGRIKFGVVAPDGHRITAHIIKNANTTNIPYMRTATLPIRVEQENTGTSASTSEMRFNCATVRHSSKSNVRPIPHSASGDIKSISFADGEVSVIAIRPKTTFNSIANRTRIVISLLELAHISGSSPVLVRLRDTVGSVIQNVSWVSHSASSTVEVASNGDTILSNIGHINASGVVMPGVVRELSQNQGENERILSFTLFADGVTQPEIIMTAQVIQSGGTANVMGSINWGEVLL